MKNIIDASEASLGKQHYYYHHNINNNHKFRSKFLKTYNIQLLPMTTNLRINNLTYISGGSQIS